MVALHPASIALIVHHKCNCISYYHTHGLASFTAGKREEETFDASFEKNDLAMYDLTSSYFEGTTCPLAKRGYSRDKKKGAGELRHNDRPTGMLSQKQLDEVKEKGDVDWITAMKSGAIRTF